MSDKEKKPLDGEAPKKKVSSGEESENEYLNFHDNEEDENISDEKKYWQKYFEEEDEEFRFRDKKKAKKKGKYKDRDSE